MLETLEIENLLIIEKVSLSFQCGYNVIIGETGSGKSIILDCLTIILGGRSNKDLIRSGADKAKIVATFNVSDNQHLLKILEENELVADHGRVIIKKIIAKDYSKTFINDTQVTLNIINLIKDFLMEIHSQFETYAMSPFNYLSYLDKFLRLSYLYPEISSAFSHMKHALRCLEAEKERVAKVVDNLEYLRVAHEDLASLDPLKDEYNFLLEERNKLLNHEKILHSVNEVYSSIEAITLKNFILGFKRQTGKIEQYISASDVSACVEAEKEFEQALIHFEEGVEIFHTFSKSLTSVAANLKPIEERIGQLRDIGRRYKTAPNELYEFYSKVKNDIAGISVAQEDLTRLQKVFEQAERDYLALCENLSSKRKAGAAAFAHAIKLHLSDLGLQSATFLVHFNENKKDYTQYGFDEIEFFVSMNPGISPAPMDKIVSGGELSRLVLCLKIITSHNSDAILFFDEIDSGVSGRVATMIGVKLRALGEGSSQIIAISHNPQVIAKAQHHFLVLKRIANSVTTTTIAELNYEEKVRFLAEMLSSNGASAESVQAAMKLFED